MPENNITILEDDDLKLFLAAISSPFTGASHPYRIRIWPQGDGRIKVKVNEGAWTYLLGKKDA